MAEIETEQIRDAFKVVANQLGCLSMKAEQRVMTNFVVGNVFTHWNWETFLLYLFTNSLSGKNKSVVVILSPLVSIIKDEVGSCIVQMPLA